MNLSKKRYKKIGLIAISMVIVLSLVGCAEFNNFISKMKGELVGNNYTITSYDNNGSKVFTVKGDKITLDGTSDTSGEMSSYIKITVDGYEWQHVGGTLVFAQGGVDMITDFQLPDEIESIKDVTTGLMGVDKIINNYRNKIGRDMVVIVSSQDNVPIGLFQGNSCYYEIPDDLPKTTRINIDGKSVYVYRGVIDIIPAGLLGAE